MNGSLFLLKNDITNNLRSQKPVIYSRYTQFMVDDFKIKKAEPLLTLPAYQRNVINISQLL